MEKGLPVKGYTDQSSQRVELVNSNKELEERVLRRIDEMKTQGSHYDQRFVALAMTHIQEGFMCLNRAVFQPGRIGLPEDDA